MFGTAANHHFQSLTTDAARPESGQAANAQLRTCGVRANHFSMDVDEQKVLLSDDGYGRVAIVRRQDGLFCLYQHWHWTPDAQRSLGIEPVKDRRWVRERARELYDGVEPLSGLYGSAEDAEVEGRRLLGLNGD